MIITISGTLGAGKSTVSKLLAERLGYKRYYGGGIRRDMAKKRGMTLEEYNKLAETDITTDTEVDYYQRDVLAKEDNLIVEGRTSYFFIPNSIKIYMKCDMDVALDRIYNDTDNPYRANETKASSKEELLESLKRRHERDELRYLKHYGTNINDEKNYDFVIDTTDILVEEVVDKILEFINNYSKQNKKRITK